MKRISLVIFLLAILAAVINCAENVTFNAADFNTIVHDQTFLDLSEALQDKFIRHLLKTPTLVFVAGQSFGKSLFIALRAAFPTTYSASNIGTRCPVKYIFRNSVVEGFEGVKVNGKIVANEKMADAVQSHMETFQKDNKFSNEELVVEVSFPDIQNAVYIDLPGIPDWSAPHYGVVVEMIRSVVSSPETIIVALMDAGKVDPASHDSNVILRAVLEPVRPNWRNEMVLLKNHVNIAMLQMHKVEEVNNYFDPAYNVGEVYHLMLNPTVDKGGLDDRKDIASKAQWLRDVKHHLEQDLFDEHIARIEAKEGRPVKSSIRDRTGIKFGLNVTINALDKKMQEKTLAMLPQLAVDVNKIIAEREERLNELKATVASFSPSATKRLYYDFTIKLVSYIRAITNYHVVTSPANDKLLDPEDFVQSFEEELYNAHFGKNDGFPGFPTYEELVDAVRMFRADPNGIAYRVETSRLVGYAAKRRFLEVFGVILLIQNMELLTMDQILREGSSANAGTCNGVDFNHALHKSLQSNVLRLNNVVPWLCNHLEHLLYHHFDDAVRLLLETPEFKVLKTHQHFIQRMTDGFRALVNERVEEVRRSVVSLIRDYSEVTPTSLSHRFDAIIALAPAESLQNPFQIHVGDYDWQDLLTSGNPVDKGCGNTFDLPAMQQTAVRNFYFIKMEILLTIERIVNAQYHYFNNEYIVNFTSAAARFFSMMTDEEVANSARLSPELTEKLSNEVTKQTEELKAINNARWKLARFISQNGLRASFSAAQQKPSVSAAEAQNLSAAATKKLREEADRRVAEDAAQTKATLAKTASEKEAADRKTTVAKAAVAAAMEEKEEIIFL